MKVAYRDIRLVWVVVMLSLMGVGCTVQQKKVSKKIDFESVKWYATRAKAAYKTEQEIRRAFPDTVRVATVANTDVQYFLERHPKSGLQVVTVRGTDNLKNVAEDAEYIPSNNPKLGIYVHRGFDTDAIKIYADLLPHLDKSHEVRVTGHSLGAAISTLLMMYLHEDGFQMGPSINFGQPKVTNKKGVQRYDFLPLLRVVDENDVVPLVPPITLLDSLHGIYEHLGEEVILLKGEHYVYLPRHDATRRSVGDFWDQLGDESITEHFMDNYLRHINDKLVGAIQVSYDSREHYIP